MKKTLIDYSFITLGSALYALAFALFVFPHSLVLGGTGGLSVIFQRFLPLGANGEGTWLAIWNFALLILAFLILGRQIAFRTFVGSTLTGLFTPFFQNLLSLKAAPIGSPVLSALAGAALIAVASAILFAVSSSSGGTDIVALILRKFTNIHIGRALLVADVLIVIAGGFLSGLWVFLYSFLGLVVKTLGIDTVMTFYIRLRIKRHKAKTEK